VTATPHEEGLVDLDVVTWTRLPAVYGFRFHVEHGGLIAYAPDELEQYRRAAAYVDRILRGDKPVDLPPPSANQVRAGDQPEDRQGARP
jgi:hypothetical protein